MGTGVGGVPRDKAAKAMIDFNIADSTSKVVDPIADHLDGKGPARVPYSLKFFCTICTKHYEIFKKDKDGNLEKQQICVHMTFLDVRFDK